MAIYSIGQLSKKTDCKIATIRYYEDIKILPIAARNAGNHRRYNETHLQCLNFIRHCRVLGFNLQEVRQLIHLQTCKNQSPHEAHRIANKHLQDVLHKISQLQGLATELEAVVKCCSEEGKQCQVLNILNKPYP